jgi:hypothetical protein
MDTKSLSLWAAVLLLVGGLVHLIPALYTGLANLTGGTPWIQIVVGILSVIVALVMFAGEKQDMGTGTPPSPTTPTDTGKDTSLGGPV